MISPLSNRYLKDAQLLLESLGELPGPVEKPIFIAISGLAGTGKSFVSQKLAAKLPLAVIESDELRKVLFPRPTMKSKQEKIRQKHYIIDTGKSITRKIDKIVHQIVNEGV